MPVQSTKPAPSALNTVADFIDPAVGLEKWPSDGDCRAVAAYLRALARPTAPVQRPGDSPMMGQNDDAEPQ